MTLAILLFTAGSLAAQTDPTAQQKEVIAWVTRSLVDEQKHLWSDWSDPKDRRVVLLAKETILFPTFAADDYSMNYEIDSLQSKQPDVYTRLTTAPVIDLGTWKPAPPDRCNARDDTFPQVNVVPGSAIERAFTGEPLDASVALVIRMSTPVFSMDGSAAFVYAEAVGSHAENSLRQLISLTRKTDRAGEWDAMIREDHLLRPAVPTRQEREISKTDRAVMTTALQWLVKTRGKFDLAGLADFPPDPAEWRRREREAESPIVVAEAALAQLSRRNNRELVFDPSIFSIAGVRNLPVGDKRIWSRPSVLVSLPAYDGDTAILSMTYRTAEEVPKTSNYLVVVKRSRGEWSVVWTSVEDGIIIS